LLFPTVTFAVFFMVVFPTSWLLMRRQLLWQAFMLVASYVFYAWWDWRFIFLLAGSTVGNHVAAAAIHRARAQQLRKLLLALSVAFNLGLLGYFKYAGFLVSSAENALTRVGLPSSSWILSVTLPIGISFFTFMAMSYVIDIYRRELEPVDFPRFAVYLAFFPHLVAGPIVRGSELLPQLKRPRDPQSINATRAYFLILSGLFFKVVIANELATNLVDSVFAAPDRHSSLEVLVAVYGYAVQIFADFMGYTNIAIGVALLLGFSFPQNFNSPYQAVSLQDFWRRWHMTLSRWLRDYLYVSLGGNRKGRARTYVNLLLTMLLGGLWHGAAWTFVIWGGLHGTGLAVERFARDIRVARGLGPPRDTALRRWVGRIVTFHVVCLGWIFFRSASVGDAGTVIKRLFTAWHEPSPLIGTGVVLAIAFGLAANYVPARVVPATFERFARLPLVAQAVCLGVGLMFVDTLGPRGVAPFIYFHF
jgi:D-alanyl-lipoteichoic acid acyltransferase DltB (MBOAT superfamily)